MRNVKYKSNYQTTEYDAEGVFHQWAQSYEEFESGPGNWTYAIIERPDGTIAQINPGMIQFTKEVPIEKESSMDWR